jgi:hypothetical protein
VKQSRSPAAPRRNKLPGRATGPGRGMRPGRQPTTSCAPRARAPYFWWRSMRCRAQCGAVQSCASRHGAGDEAPALQSAASCATPAADSSRGNAGAPKQPGQRLRRAWAPAMQRPAAHAPGPPLRARASLLRGTAAASVAQPCAASATPGAARRLNRRHACNLIPPHARQPVCCHKVQMKGRPAAPHPAPSPTHCPPAKGKASLASIPR